MTSAPTIGCCELHNSHVQHTEAEEGRAARSVTEQTHSQRATDWRFSAVWEP